MPAHVLGRDPAGVASTRWRDALMSTTWIAAPLAAPGAGPGGPSSRGSRPGRPRLGTGIVGLELGLGAARCGGAAPRPLSGRLVGRIVVVAIGGGL
jgi:hypothetical protein